MQARASTPEASTGDAHGLSGAEGAMRNADVAHPLSNPAMNDMRKKA